MLSAVTSALHKKRPEPASFLQEPPRQKDIGKPGPSSAERSAWIQHSRKSTTLLPYSKSTLKGIAQGKLHPTTTQYDLKRWQTVYAPLDKRLHSWGPMTLA